MANKYVMIDGCMPILFTGCQVHSDFRCMGNITSAGFFTLNDRQEASVYGESVSLGIKSDKQDAKWITKMFNPY